MPYNPNIPQANDDPRVSQGELLQNFQQINADFSVNHTALTASGQNGYHTKLFFPNGIADPNLAAPESSLYPKLVSGLAELFFQNGPLAADAKQLTNLPVTTVGNNHSILTPWGWRINMGIAAANPATFAVAFPVGFTLYYAGLGKATPAIANNPIISNVTNTQIFITNVSNTYYIAIGTA